MSRRPVFVQLTSQEYITSLNEWEISYNMAGFRDICCDICLDHVEIVIACSNKSSKFNSFACTLVVLDFMYSVVQTFHWRIKAIYFASFNSIHKIRGNKNLVKISTYAVSAVYICDLYLPRLPDTFSNSLSASFELLAKNASSSALIYKIKINCNFLKNEWHQTGELPQVIKLSRKWDHALCTRTSKHTEDNFSIWIWVSYFPRVKY